MPSRIVVVHDEIEFLAQVGTALRHAGYDVTEFTDPITASRALRSLRGAELLITRTFFRPGMLNGGSLALMARARHPELQVIFLASPEHAMEILNLGEFLPAPVSMPNLKRIP